MQPPYADTAASASPAPGVRTNVSFLREDPSVTHFAARMPLQRPSLGVALALRECTDGCDETVSRRPARVGQRGETAVSL